MLTEYQNLMRNTKSRLSEDAIQDTACKYLELKNLGRDIDPLVFRAIARNRQIDIHRRERKSKSLSVLTESEATAVRLRTLSRSDPAQIAIDREELKRILSVLSLSEQQLLRMRFFEERTHKDIAETLGMPLGTVHSRVRRIIMRLKQTHIAH